AGRALQFFFDAQELIVLRDPIRAARRTGLDLPGVRGHGQVGDGRVLGFPAAVADDRGVAVPPGELDGVERFRQRTDLVPLDQNTVARRLGDALLQALGVRDEEVVTHQLHATAELARELLPAGPVVLGQAVFDRANRPAGAELFPQVDHFVRCGDVIGTALEEAVAGLAL